MFDAKTVESLIRTEDYYNAAESLKGYIATDGTDAIFWLLDHADTEHVDEDKECCLILATMLLDQGGNLNAVCTSGTNKGKSSFTLAIESMDTRLFAYCEAALRKNEILQAVLRSNELEKSHILYGCGPAYEIFENATLAPDASDGYKAIKQQHISIGTYYIEQGGLDGFDFDRITDSTDMVVIGNMIRFASEGYPEPLETLLIRSIVEPLGINATTINERCIQCIKMQFGDTLWESSQNVFNLLLAVNAIRVNPAKLQNESELNSLLELARKAYESGFSEAYLALGKFFEKNNCTPGACMAYSKLEPGNPESDRANYFIANAYLQDRDKGHSDNRLIAALTAAFKVRDGYWNILEVRRALACDFVYGEDWRQRGFFMPGIGERKRYESLPHGFDIEKLTDDRNVYQFMQVGMEQATKMMHKTQTPPGDDKADDFKGPQTKRNTEDEPPTKRATLFGRIFTPNPPVQAAGNKGKSNSKVSEGCPVRIPNSGCNGR